MKRAEYRKLQFIGGSSFMVSLPKDWVEKFNLRQGDTLLVSVEEEGSIRIIPSTLIGRTEPPERAIIEEPDFKESERFKREIFAYYLLGIDQIEIQMKNRVTPEVTSILNDITRSLIGIEITSMERDKIVLSCLTSKDLSIDSVTTRMKQLVSTIIEGICDYVEHLNENLIPSLVDMEEDVDRFYLLSVRLENIGMRKMHDSGLSSWDFLRMLLGHRLITKCVEEISDELMKVLDHLRGIRLNSAEKSMIVSELEALRSCFESSIDAFTNEDLENAHRSYELGRRIEERLKKKFEENSKTEISERKDIRLQFVIHSLIELCRIFRTISEIAINRGVRVRLKKF
jgi:phosphate uptake regulator